ncbi:MAG: hypothetical protein NY202_00190 [Mollicutes bacterium UO1]
MPHLIKKERKIALIKEGLSESILAECQKNKVVELLTVDEVRQKVADGKKSQ